MKKKGFTLIELLAVIVILAIISVITLPTILGIIEKAKKGSFEQSVRGIMETANLYYANNLDNIGENDVVTFVCNGKTCENKNGNKLDFKGTIPTSGQVVLTGKQEISVKSLRMNGYCASGTSKTLQIAKDCKDIDLTPPELKLFYPQVATSQIIIPFESSDPDSGIKKITCVYGTDTNYGSEGVVVVGEENNYCLIDKKLKPNTKYYYKIGAKNGLGLIASETGEAILGNAGIEFEVTNIPDGKEYEYAQSKKIKISYGVSNVTKPSYYLKTTVNTTIDIDAYSCEGNIEPESCSTDKKTKNLETNTWYKVDKNINVTFKDNGIIYAMINDGNKYLEAETLTITKIDTTEPIISSLTTTSATITSMSLIAICKDEESGIIKYEFSKDDGKTWIDNEKKAGYTFTKLEENKSYKFKVRCTNGAGLKKISDTKDVTLTAPTITFIEDPSAGSYSIKKAVTVEFNKQTITDPMYYVKTNIATTINENVYSCGTNVEPENCSTTATTNLNANTWYKTSAKPTITLSDNGTIYALVYDGSEYLTAETRTITTIIKSADQIYYNNSTYTNGADITVQAAIEDLYKRLSK